MSESRRIWKFPLDLVDKQTIHMPMHSDILCVQIQQGAPCLWALVEPENAKRPRIIHIVGTGNPYPDVPLLYLDTVQQMDGVLVWHMFEEVPE